MLIIYHLVHAKRKSPFKHAQTVRIHIILDMRKILSGHLLSIETFYIIQWFCIRAAKVLIRLRGCAVWSRPSLYAYVRTYVFASLFFAPTITSWSFPLESMQTKLLVDVSVIIEFNRINQDFINLYTLWVKLSRRETGDFFYFRQKIGFNISCKLSPLEKLCIKCKNLFPPENRIWNFIQLVSIRENLHEVSKPVFRENKIFSSPKPKA